MAESRQSRQWRDELPCLLLQIPDNFNDIDDGLRALPTLFRFGRTLFILQGVHTADVDEKVLQEGDLSPGENGSMVAQRTGFKMFSVSAHCQYSNFSYLLFTHGTFLV